MKYKYILLILIYKMLHIKFADNLSSEIKNYYSKKTLEVSTDSGFDLICPDDFMLNPMKSTTIDFKIQCKFVNNNDTSAYLLMPRSSISKTNLMMMNSIGLIDKDYRGNIMAKVKNVSEINESNVEYVKKYNRLFQIVGPNFQPFKVKIVTELDETSRGSGGFGSTGLNI
jgi:dUTP pyrophosphatase